MMPECCLSQLHKQKCFKPYLKLDLIKKIRKLKIKAINSGCHIRWFHYRNSYKKENIITNSLYALNSFETNIMSLTAQQFFAALLLLTPINKESLVFLYDNPDYPPVLFTADSNLGGTQLSLKDYSIVTAPHHGSTDNKNVYSLIPDPNNNLVYVRSDYKNRHRPCSEYIKLPIKHCTICNNSTNPNANTIKLSYTKGNHWSPSTSTCTCK